MNGARARPGRSRSPATTRCRRSPALDHPCGLGPPVHPFDEVADVGVALRRRQPFGRRARARCRRTRRRRGDRRRTTARAGRAGPVPRRAGPCPAPYQRCSTPMALRRPPVTDAGQVHRPRVLLVGVREAGPRVDRVRRRRTAGRCAPRRRRRWRGATRAGRRRDLGAQVGERGRAAARRRPGAATGPASRPSRSAVVKRAGADTGPQRRPPPAGLDRPLVGRVGGERRAAVGDEGLPSRDARGRCPTRVPPWPGSVRRTTMR